MSRTHRQLSAPTSAERLAEIDAALAELRQRLDAQPKNEFTRRARLALLIEAFGRTRDRTEAALCATREDYPR